MGRTILCEKCKSTFNESVLANRENPNICPVCGESLIGDNDSSTGNQSKTTKWYFYKGLSETLTDTLYDDEEPLYTFDAVDVEDAKRQLKEVLPNSPLVNDNSPEKVRCPRCRSTEIQLVPRKYSLLITNRNSVAMSDMAVAMSEAGTVASSYRVSIEDLSAMIGTMESVTKLGGSEVGNGIKAILINLQNINSSKIVNTLDAANASMTEFVNGTEKLRDPISILRDLAKTFNQLDEDDALRAEILTNIGGKHQASKLAALLQNMEMFDKMLVDYFEGAGSAMEEAMKSANNWSGKLNQIQNSWNSLVNSLTSKKAVLGGLTFFDKLIQGAGSAVNTLGEIPVVLTTINTAMTAMKKDYGITQLVNPETKKLDVQGNIFGIDFTEIKNQKKHFEEAKDAIAKWNKELKGGKVDIEAFNDSVVQNSASLKEYLSTCSKDAPASLKGYRQYHSIVSIIGI